MVGEGAENSAPEIASFPYGEDSTCKERKKERKETLWPRTVFCDTVLTRRILPFANAESFAGVKFGSAGARITLVGSLRALPKAAAFLCEESPG